MKKLIVLIVLAMLAVLLIPLPCWADGSKCCKTVKFKRGADCDNYWHKATWGNICGSVVSSDGLGSWAWGSKTAVNLPSAWIVFSSNHKCVSGFPSTVHKIVKSDWCDPVTGKKRSGPGSSSESFSLPKRQKYLLLDDGQMYCYTIMQTPILGNAKDAWCLDGTAPEEINDFCLQSNYQGLFGCILENYDVHHVSYRRMRRYR